MSYRTSSASPLTDFDGRPAPPSAQVTERVQQAADVAHQLIEVAKPRLRGWLHAAIAPVTLAAGLVLVTLSPAGTPRLGLAGFSISGLILFTVSATLHRGRWAGPTNAILTRLDHACIFLLIA